MVCETVAEVSYACGSGEIIAGALSFLKPAREVEVVSILEDKAFRR